MQRENLLTTQDIAEYETVELSDLNCPHLLIAVIQAITNLEPGQVIQVTATDLNAPSSISSWARQSGNLLLEMYEENGCFVFYLQRAARESAPPLVQDKDDSLDSEGPERRAAA